MNNMLFNNWGIQYGIFWHHTIRLPTTVGQQVLQIHSCTLGSEEIQEQSISSTLQRARWEIQMDAFARTSTFSYGSSTRLGSICADAFMCVQLPDPSIWKQNYSFLFIIATTIPPNENQQFSALLTVLYKAKSTRLCAYSSSQSLGY